MESGPSVGDKALQALNAALSRHDIVVDSGSSTHLTNDIGCLSDYGYCDIDVRFGGSISHASAVGTMFVDVVNGKDMQKLELKDTLYVPALPANLVSTEKLYDHGYFYRTDLQQLFTYSTDGLRTEIPIANVYRRNGLPYLQTPTSSPDDVALASQETPSTPTTHGVADSDSQADDVLSQLPPDVSNSSNLMFVSGTIGSEPVRCQLDSNSHEHRIDAGFVKRHLAMMAHGDGCKVDSSSLSLHGNGQLAHAELDLNGHCEEVELAVHRLAGHDVVLGLPWFVQHLPRISLTTFTIIVGRGSTETVELRCQVMNAGQTVAATPNQRSAHHAVSLLASSGRSTRAGKSTAVHAEDSGESQDEYKPDSKKRIKASAATPKKRSKKAVRVDLDNPGIPAVINKATVTSLTDLDLDKIGIAQDHNTTILNSWVDLVTDYELKEKPGLLHEYTPQFEQAQHVLDLDLYDPDHRQFQFIEDEVALVDHRQPDGSTTKAWAMKARNIKAPQDDDVDLFWLHAYFRSGVKCVRCLSFPDRGPGCDRRKCDKDPQGCNVCHRDGQKAECEAACRERDTVQFAVMTEDVCANKEKIIELGKITVEVMNKVPHDDLGLKEWKAKEWKGGQPTGTSQVRLFIETTSLMQWKRAHMKQFNLGELPHLDSIGGRKAGDPWQVQWYRPPHSYQEKGGRILTTQPIGIWRTDDLSDRHMEPVMTWKDVDKAVIDSIDYDPSYHIFGPEPSEDNVEERYFSSVELSGQPQKMAAIRAMQLIMVEMVGMVGTKELLRRKWEDIRVRYLESAEHKYLGKGGPYNNGHIWSIQRFHGLERSISSWTLRPVKQVVESLETDKLPVDTEKQLFARLSIEVPVENRACIAWVAQQSLDSIARGEGLLKALFSAVVAAQYLASGLLTISDVLNAYCKCESDHDEATTEHYCTSCWSLRPCAKMFKEQTADGMAPKCAGCSGKTFHRTDASAVSHKIKWAAQVCHKQDSIFHTPHWSPDELSERLISNHATEDPLVWTDGYVEAERSNVSLMDARYEAWLQALGCPHPLRLSIEKPYNKWVRSDGKISIHDPENVILTKDCINRFKRDHPPSELPLQKQALLLRKKVDGRAPCVGYYPDVQGEWDVLEDAHAHQRLIALFTTRSGAVPTPVDKQVVSMGFDGVWDGHTLPSRGVTKLFKSRGQISPGPMNPDNTPKFTMEDEYWDWEVIMNDIDFMEKDVRFNPHDLRVPRLGINKIPWLWRTQDCPDDCDYDEEFLFKEFNARLRTIVLGCNRHHTTDESPATMFLEYVAQWLENGGKCHIFGCIMSHWIGFPSVYSFGRGITQKGAGKDGGDRTIQAGDRMQTGCKTLLPRDMSTDYDVGRRTVVVESWKANTLRYCYPNLPEIREILEEAIEDLVDSCSWYGPVLSTYPKITLPTSKDQAQWRTEMKELSATFEQPSVVTSPDEALLDSEDVFDDEVLCYEEIQAGVDSVQQGGQDAVDSAQEGEQEAIEPKTHAEVDAIIESDKKFLESLSIPPEQLKELMTRMGRHMKLSEAQMRSGVDGD